MIKNDKELKEKLELLNEVYNEIFPGEEDSLGLIEKEEEINEYLDREFTV